MLEKISYYIKKYESVLLYLIFGVLTTLVNFAAYHICYTKLQFPNLVSNTIAWILSVLFAFITNKIWVFKNSKRDMGSIIKFYLTYMSTWLLSALLLYIWVEKMGISDKIAPVINVFITTPINYLLNKYWVFKKNKKSM